MNTDFDFSEEVLGLFWDKVDKSPGFGPNGTCWRWTASTHRQGYGMFSMRQRSTRSHRVAFAIVNGNFQASLLVCHSCDNPGCVNPDHLSLGAHKDNTADMVLRHRHGGQIKTRCKRGHELVVENIIPSSLAKGKRECLICHKELVVKRRQGYAELGIVAPTALKQCSRCKETKECSFFTATIHTKSGYTSWCKVCAAQAARESCAKKQLLNECGAIDG